MIQKTTDSKGRTYEYVEGDPIRARIYTLANGLKVYLSPNDRKPEIQVFVGVNAGSNDDPDNATGLAHYLEHLMFKGTKKVGTVDYDREKPMLDEIEALFEEYGAETDPERRKEIYRKIDAVSNEASKLAVAQESWKLFESIGATGMNAATGNYRTYFQCVIPSTEIRRWAILESDRFANPVFRGFHTELETVYEEYNMISSMEDIMTNALTGETNRLLYGDIPYCQHPVIGKPEHLKSPSLKKLKEFYKTYYCANNMALILCGDLDCEETMDIIEEHFSRLRRNDSLPERRRHVIPGLISPVETELSGPGPERLYLAWRFPGTVHPSKEDAMDALRIIMLITVLSHGGCGLIDDFVNKDRLALTTDVMVLANSDYNTLFLTAEPNEGQTMAGLKDKLLGLVDRLKKGDFEDRRIPAAVNQFMSDSIINRKDNYFRADVLLDSFVNDDDYSDSVTRMERFAAITKQDVMDAASRYLTDGYLCVVKHTGPSDMHGIEKPEISPIDLGRERQSAFAAEFLSMDTEKVGPRFPDFRGEISTSTLPTGQTLIYRHNADDEIFSMGFRSEVGTVRDRWLSLMPAYMNQIGTPGMSPHERKLRLYELAGVAEFNTTFRHCSIGLSGIQENFEETFRIVDEWMTDAVNDEPAFRKIASAKAEEAVIRKSEFDSCQRALFQYCVYGGRNFVENVGFTPDELEEISGSAMLNHIRAFTRGLDTVIYYGPASEEEVRAVLGRSALARAFDGTRMGPTTFQPCDVTKPEILVQDYDSPTSFVFMRAGWGEGVNPGDEAYFELLNRYLHAVANQEVREARSLAYSSTAGCFMPICRNESFQIFGISLTQNSKVRECVETMEGILRDLPLSESIFSRVKEQYTASLRTRRVLDDDLLRTFIAERNLGYDHDHMEDVYAALPGITLESLAEFHRSRLAGHPLSCAIVGRTAELDMDFLRSRGEVRMIPKEETFGY